MLLAPNTPAQGTQQNTNEQRDTNAEQEVVFTAYSMQPTQGCSWRQLYHNGPNWNLQIDAVLAFSAQCPWHHNVKTTSIAITTACSAQAVASCSEHFAKPKCYYALTLTTFGLRLNLIQLLSVLLCLCTCIQFSNLVCFPFSWLLLLLHFTLVFVRLCFVTLIRC